MKINYTYFCLNAQVRDRNMRSVHLKGVHLDKISKSIQNNVIINFYLNYQELKFESNILTYFD